MNLVEIGYGRLLPAGLQGWPLKVVKHIADATGVPPSPAGPPGTFQIPSSSKDVFKYSFFSQTIRALNYLPEYLISSSELSDYNTYLCLSMLIVNAGQRPLCSALHLSDLQLPVS